MSDQEYSAVQILRQRLELAEADAVDLNRDVNAEWLWNVHQIREFALHDDPRSFLEWSPIRHTMFTGNAPYIANELAYLRGLPDWDSRWKNALKESRVGNPSLYPAFPASSANLIHHAYHVSRFERVSRLPVKDSSSVVEFGGGYGSMCRLFFKLGFLGTYAILDLPVLTAMQQFYLSLSDYPVIMSAHARRDPVVAFCTSSLQELDDCLNLDKGRAKSLFIATWSLSEAPPPLR